MVRESRVVSAALQWGFWLVRYANRFVSISEIYEHHVYWRGISANPVVVDLGGNIGRFSDAISRRLNGRVIYVEADPELCRQVTFDAPTRVEIRNLAISNKNEQIRLFRSRNSEATSTNRMIAEAWGLEGVFDVQGSTFDSFLEHDKVSYVDVLKIDVEGS